MFACTPGAPHEDACPCCDGTAAAMTALYATLAVVDQGLTTRIMRDDGEPERPEEDPFLTEELALAAVLATRWGIASGPSRERLLQAVQPVATPGFDRVAFSQAVNEARDLMGDVVDGISSVRVATLLDDALSNGALDAVAGETDATKRLTHRPKRPPRTTILSQGTVGEGTILAEAASILLPDRSGIVWENLARATKYYSNRFFNEEMMPALLESVNAIVAGTSDGGRADFDALRAAVDRHFRTVPYWKTVANAAVSRGYHYGYLQAAQKLGATAYVLMAVVDQRTSKLCLFMNGKTFQVRDALDIMEQVAEAPDMETVKRVMPWRRLKDVEEDDTEGLRAKGFIVPPFHGRCRTTIRFLR